MSNLTTQVILFSRDASNFYDVQKRNKRTYMIAAGERQKT
jgi:hypothetical protein